jgi:hypothetical protein
VPVGKQAEYEAFLKEREEALNGCKEFLYEACKLAAAAYKRGHAGDLAVIALANHVVENLDGASLLLARGSVLPCYPLLRSIFDAWMGVLFILEKDSDDRGVAYFVAQLSAEKRLWEQHDPSTQLGKTIREDLKDDHGSPQPFDALPLQEVRRRIAELQAELDDPMLKPTAQAWASKKKADPAWYSLVAPPTHLRDLAKSLGRLSMYEQNYRPWCREVHATGTIANLGTNGDAIRIRPVRHPDGIDRVIRSAGVLAITLAACLRNKYRASPDGSDAKRYKDLEAKLNTLASAKVQPWDDEGQKGPGEV